MGKQRQRKTPDTREGRSKKEREKACTHTNSITFLPGVCGEKNKTKNKNRSAAISLSPNSQI